MSAAVQPKIYQTAWNEIWFDHEGFLWVRAMESEELDLDEVKACFEIYRQLGCDKNKVLQVIDVRNSVTMTKEARDYVAQEAKYFFRASAIISDSLSVRLIVNFFNFFYKHSVPIKLFKSEEDALKWLRKFRK